MADPADAFNGANPADFDHDDDGKPGGGKPDANAVRVALVEVETGAILTTSQRTAARQVAAGTARKATAQDLEIAGRRDLLPLL